jgi:hypothetical protein
MKTKKQQGIRAGAPPPSVAAPPRSRRGRMLLVVSALGLCAATWAFFEFVVWNKLPSALVGKWVVMEGPDEGGTVDFYRNGTMVAVVNNRGLKGIMKARIRVEGKNIHVTTTHQLTGAEGTRVQTIRVLDAQYLVLEDERGVSVKLERAN